MSYDCSHCGYKFEPLDEETIGPFCDCPRCGGLAVLEEGQQAQAETEEDPFALPDDENEFSGMTGAIPLNEAKLSASFQRSLCEPKAQSNRGARAAPAPRKLVKRCASGCCFIVSAILVSNSLIILRDSLIWLTKSLTTIADGTISASSSLSNFAARMRSIIASCCCSLRVECSLNTRRINRRSARRS